MIPEGYERRELTSSPADIELLRRFYQDVYVAEFPDPDERESLENMERYLRLKADGWYGNNSYHILVYLDRGRPIGGSIIDYLEEANAGVIEFLLVTPSLRKRGLGEALLRWTEEVLRRDAVRSRHADWDYVVGEMNDPFKTDGETDSIDPYQRAMIWHRWGFKKVSFPYVQPALSQDKAPVRNMLLVCKPATAKDPHVISSAVLRATVYGYAQWAMRVEKPDENPECREMASYLARRQKIDLVPLAAYVGDPSALDVTVSELAAGASKELEAVLDLYAREFRAGPTTLPHEQFREALRAGASEKDGFSYHLWSIKIGAGGDADGMASFFTFPGAGFGGYLALTSARRGKGYTPQIITLMERCMVLDKKSAYGWYCECLPSDGTATIFRKHGFYEADIVYRQPPLSGGATYAFDAAPVLHLMYKAFGENYEAPRVSTEQFEDALKWIYRVVYDIEQPETTDFCRDIRRQMAGKKLVGWK